MPKCNSTLSDENIHETPLWHGYTFHHFGLFLSGAFALLATVIGLTLIFLHATHYLRPSEQRHIIRILLLIPIYSVVSFLSYLYYQHAIYFDILEGCYEAFAISSFFTLLCNYIAPTLHDQKDYFRTISPIKNWFWGVFGLQLISGGENKGPFRKPRSGLTWFNVIWIGVFQYCFIRVFFTIVAVLAQIGDVYCEDSLSPAFAHVWVQVFEAVSVTIAMFCLIQFYLQLKDDLAQHRPFLKVLCIKLVIFFSFWQTIVITFLSGAHGPLQPTKHLSYPDINVGIPSTLLCIEMAIFAVMHIFAFPWRPYSLKHAQRHKLSEPSNGFSSSFDGTYGGSQPNYAHGIVGALADAFNPWDIIKMTARGFRWLFIGVRKRHEDVSYSNVANPAKQTTGYVGPTYAGTSEAATELERRNKSEDDRAGLLTNQTSIGQRSANGGGGGLYGQYNDYASASRDQSQIDISSAPPRNTPYQQQQGYDSHPPGPNPMDFDMKPSDFDDDTSYHPHMGPAAGAGRADAGGAVHPAYRPQGSGWPLSDGAESICRRSREELPPGYRPPR